MAFAPLRVNGHVQGKKVEFKSEIFNVLHSNNIY